MQLEYFRMLFIKSVFCIFLPCGVCAGQVPDVNYIAIVNEAHRIPEAMKKSISISKAKNLTIDYNTISKSVQEKLATHDVKLNKLLLETYTKEFQKNFTKVELEYIRQLYTNVLMTKILKFNDQFIASPEVKKMIDESVTRLKEDLALKSK